MVWGFHPTFMSYSPTFPLHSFPIRQVGNWCFIEGHLPLHLGFMELHALGKCPCSRPHFHTTLPLALLQVHLIQYLRYPDYNFLQLALYAFPSLISSRWDPRRGSAFSFPQQPWFWKPMTACLTTDDLLPHYQLTVSLPIAYLVVTWALQCLPSLS